ncbi:MAG: hypothetical protein JWQ00_2222 [Noviherbaspirillum sp.]|nr:hypothetical protein [Noviherbaspirillum sp.]
MTTVFPRQLAPETLDGLAEDDPRAIGSRRDLRRINRIMGAAGIIADAIGPLDRAPRRILELGAGDGSLMLRLAKRFALAWPRAHLSLLDRQNLIGDGTRRAFNELGWTVEVVRSEVGAWAAQLSGEKWDLCIANLFIHHFDQAQIAALFGALGAHTDRFVACEPRRARLPLFASRLVGLIGANAVTREDAVLSVKAGFRDRELSALWPDARAEWQLEEAAAGLFSHRFVAVRRSAA